jgi:hypothetical protein
MLKTKKKNSQEEQQQNEEDDFAKPVGCRVEQINYFQERRRWAALAALGTSSYE